MVDRKRQRLRGPAAAVAAVGSCFIAGTAYASDFGEGIALLFLEGIFLLTLGLILSPIAKWMVVRSITGRSPALAVLGLAALLETVFFIICLLIGGWALIHDRGGGFFVVSLVSVLYGMAATAVNIPLIRERGERFLDLLGDPKRILAGLIFGLMLPVVFLLVVIPIDRAVNRELKERRAKLMPPAHMVPRPGPATAAPLAENNRKPIYVVPEPAPRPSAVAPMTPRNEP